VVLSNGEVHEVPEQMRQTCAKLRLIGTGLCAHP